MSSKEKRFDQNDKDPHLPLPANETESCKSSLRPRGGVCGIFC